MAFGNRPRWTYIAPCQCSDAVAFREQEKRKEEEEKRIREQAAAMDERRARIARLIGTSGLGQRFRLRTFDAFTIDKGNAGAKAAAKKYADHFERIKDNPDTREKNGIFLTGTVGTGKTHLAAAVANDLLDRGVPVIFATMIDLLQKLKDTFEKGGEADLLRTYIDADLLIIDDLGKEQPTEWALTKIYQIINARYEDYKPIIITSNYTLDDLITRMTPRSGDKSTAEAAVDRLREMTYTLPLAGDSHR